VRPNDPSKVASRGRGDFIRALLSDFCKRPPGTPEPGGVGRVCVADSEPSGLRGRNSGCRPGIRTGRLQTEIVESFIAWSADIIPQDAINLLFAFASDGVVFGGIVAQGGSLHRFLPVTLALEAGYQPSGRRRFAFCLHADKGD